MANAASNYTENKVLDHILKVASFTQPTALYVGLFNNTSTLAAANLEAGIITDEISGGSYIRKAVTFGAAVSGTSANSAAVTFDVASANWGSIDFIAVLDAETAGNVLFYGAPNLVKSIDTGDIFQISIGNLTISLS